MRAAETELGTADCGAMQGGMSDVWQAVPLSSAVAGRASTRARLWALLWSAVLVLIVAQYSTVAARCERTGTAYGLLALCTPPVSRAAVGSCQLAQPVRAPGGGSGVWCGVCRPWLARGRQRGALGVLESSGDSWVQHRVSTPWMLGHWIGRPPPLCPVPATAARVETAGIGF